MPRPHRTRVAIIASVVLTASIGAGCAPAARTTTPSSPRTLAVTAVPLLTNEMQDTLPFLKDDFGPGGVLAGKEVFGFYPSTLVATAGETVQLSVINPTADEHTFTGPELGLNVAVQPQSEAQAEFTATQVGAFDFVCSIPEHAPYMRGTLIVNAPSGNARAAGVAARRTGL